MTANRKIFGLMGACLRKKKTRKLSSLRSGDTPSTESEVVTQVQVQQQEPEPKVEEKPVKQAPPVKKKQIILTPKPSNIGWSVSDDGDLCYYVMVDRVEGDKLLDKMKKYPKTGRLRYGCTLEASKKVYKGDEKLMLTVKHPNSEYILIERAVRDFYMNKVLMRPESRHHYSLGMDFYRPQMDFDKYAERVEMFAKNELIDIYHDRPRQVTPLPELNEFQTGYVEPPAGPNFKDLPFVNFRHPGWQWTDGRPAYVLLIVRCDDLLRRLYNQKSKMRLMHKCEGSLFRSLYNGQEVIILKIIHHEDSFKYIDSAVRAVVMFGFPDIPEFYTYTHRNLKTSGFDPKYCARLLNLNEEYESPNQNTEEGVESNNVDEKETEKAS